VEITVDPETRQELNRLEDRWDRDRREFWDAMDQLVKQVSALGQTVAVQQKILESYEAHIQAHDADSRDWRQALIDHGVDVAKLGAMGLIGWLLAGGAV
jgi:septal ring factor EnvC (AmiA/AmiB activator)